MLRLAGDFVGGLRECLTPLAGRRLLKILCLLPQFRTLPDQPNQGLDHILAQGNGHATAAEELAEDHQEGFGIEVAVPTAENQEGRIVQVAKKGQAPTPKDYPGSLFSFCIWSPPSN